MKIYYPYRILLDYSFLEWLLKKCPTKSKIIMNFMFINNSSKEYKKNHILVLKEDFEKLKSEGLIKSVSLFKGGVTVVQDFPFDISSLEKNGENILEKRILFGIFLTDDSPFRSVILTTEKNISEYNENDLINKVKDLSIKSEKEGEYIIENLFRKYCNEKDLHR